MTLMPSQGEGSLKQRVLNAGLWSFGGYAISQLLRFGSNLLMTRVLVPEMFGVMAIAGTVMMGLTMLSDVGLRQGVVQSRRGKDPTFLNTAWVTQILRGVLISIIAISVSMLFLIAHYLGLVPVDSVYADTRLPAIIFALALNAIIAGFESTKLLEASRSLSLRRATIIDISAQFASLLLMVSWASIDRSIWVLVGGSICSSLIRTILSHAWLPGAANHWHWDGSAFRDIIHFGKWMFLSSILGFLVNSGDRLLLGGMVSPSTFGVYVIAFLIFSSFEQILTKIIGDVSFPALSQIARERPEDLKRHYYRFHSLMASFAYFSSGLLMASGESIIRLLYDRRYGQAGWMLEVLAAILLTVPFRLATQSFLALGMPRLLTNIIAVRLVTLFVITPIGFHLFGLPGALGGIVASHFSYLPTIVLYNVRYRLFSLRRELYPLPMIGLGIGIGKVFASAIGHWS